MRLKRVAAFAVATVLLSAIALLAVGTRSSTPASEAGAVSNPSRIVILFDVDMLRADRLGIYGYERPSSPNLDRAMAEGLVAERAITSAGWTLPAHASLFSSQPVSAHGVRTALQKVPATVPLLAEVLSANGIRCLGIQSGGYVDEGFGFGRGFERYLFTTDRIDRKVQGALRFVDQAGPGPLFLFVHTVQVHNFQATERGARAVFGSTDSLGPRWTEPFSALVEARATYGDTKIASWLSARYDAAVREVDESLGELIAGIQARGLSDRTALVFTSDHGEELGERPLKTADSAPARGHTIPYLYEEHVRIPLALRAPWRKELRGRIAQPVSTLDVAPTILDLFDVAIPPGMTGVSLGRPRPAGRVVVSEAAPYGAIALLEGSHKVIVRPGFRARHWETGSWLDRLPAQECFDLGRDPAEQNGTACTEPWARRLLGEAARTVASSFPGDFVVRAEPRGGPCRLDMGSASESAVRFFGAPPDVRVTTAGGTESVDLGGADGPVWLAVQPGGDDRALWLHVTGCGDVRTAAGKSLPPASETSWSDLLWRGERNLPEGTVVFSVAPGPRTPRENANYPPELTARLRSLGYVSADRVVPASTRPAGPAPEGALPPPGRIRIKVGS
jgi:arylsulfatase A-like enzyme